LGIFTVNPPEKRVERVTGWIAGNRTLSFVGDSLWKISLRSSSPFNQNLSVSLCFSSSHLGLPISLPPELSVFSLSLISISSSPTIISFSETRTEKGKGKSKKEEER
jgi:hypothetical protein